jgi:hypothetical protein
MKTVQERFNEKYEVNQETGCWEWSLSLDSKGYGRMQVNGKRWIASRLSYELHVGEIPDGLLVCHECDNPKCVNPECLFLGTQTENMRDMVAKGRKSLKYGEDACNAKLSASQVKLIKQFLKRYPIIKGPKAGNVIGFLSDWFSIGRRTIQDIFHERHWNHVEVTQ